MTNKPRDRRRGEDPREDDLATRGGGGGVGEYKGQRSRGTEGKQTRQGEQAHAGERKRERRREERG